MYAVLMVFSLNHFVLDLYRTLTMKKGSSNGDKASQNISEDEEVSQATPEIHSLNEQSEKNVNLLDILKNFFTNHALGKSSTTSELNESKKKTVKSENESIKNYKNASKQLLTKNGRNVGNSNGGVLKKNGSGQTNQRDVNQRLICKNPELEPNHNNARVTPRKGSLHGNHSVKGPSEFANRIYENLRPPALQRVQQGVSEAAPSLKPPSQKEHQNANPETRIRNNREEAICERLADERRERTFVRASVTSPNVQHRRHSSTGHSGDTRRPTFRVMRFIQNNVRRMSLPNIHSGGVVLLNNVEGTNVKFSELRADMDPIRDETLTHERISHAGLMSGGSVVFEGFSEAFAIPDFYREDPVVFDALADDLKFPERVPKFEVFQPTASPRPVLARSHSGGSVAEVDISEKTALPELFPTKKTPPKPSPNRLHSGGGVVESDDFQNQISVDLLSQSIRFDVGQSKRSPASDEKGGLHTS